MTMIEIRKSPLGLGIHAARGFEVGEVILEGWGQVTSIRTRHTIQIDHKRHVLVDGEIKLLNHSCETNCGYLIRRGVPRLEVHALVPIEQGDELTVDYASFEDEILFLGPCLCGSESCRGSISGYHELPEERRRAYGPYVAEYLVDSAILAEPAN
jgi:hypothetical protein